MIPFYIHYSIFGFQRVGDLAWAAGDLRARGFLIGGTAGRTTLNGEGLQHEDGHSHLFSATIPNCVSSHRTFSYEVAVIVQDGLRRMYAEQEDVFYYLTVMNENYEHPAMPEGVEEGILKGMYLFRDGQAREKAPRVQLLGSGAILREVIAAAEMLAQDFDVAADVWSCPSFTELAREAMAVERWNLLHPIEPSAQVPRRVLPGNHGRGRSWQRPTTCASLPTRSALCAAPLPGARHGRVRPVRLPQAPARLLRGRPALGRRGGAQDPGRRGEDQAVSWSQAIAKYGIDPEKARALDSLSLQGRHRKQRPASMRPPDRRRKRCGDRGENPRYRRRQGRADR